MLCERAGLQIKSLKVRTSHVPYNMSTRDHRPFGLQSNSIGLRGKQVLKLHCVCNLLKCCLDAYLSCLLLLIISTLFSVAVKVSKQHDPRRTHTQAHAHGHVLVGQSGMK